ncbi:hypothetical protein ACFWH4_01020 [Streptomyces sp. NPDC127091]|uniref:hypothetical protein n=1 Tax=Streptomyces sp. NPDC127091 TaxID=3347134 RepID=UPI003656ED75
MSTESTTKPTGPLGCTRCGNTDGPHDLRTGLCETCDPAAELRSALEDGGHLNQAAARLMNNYAAAILHNTAGTLRTIPGCETAARIVDNIARGRTQ